MGKIKCLNCGKILESKHRHDFQMCGCKNQTFVVETIISDGCGGKNLSKIEILDEKGKKVKPKKEKKRVPKTMSVHDGSVSGVDGGIPTRRAVIQDNDGFGFVVIAAVRYSLGRKTYAPGIVCGFVQQHWEAIPENDREIIKEELWDAIEESNSTGRLLGDEADDKSWREFYEWTKGM